jgi:acetolactate synthase-1/2/3 large subunit
MSLMQHTGHLVANLLANYGVEYVFGMPGGQTAALYDGIFSLSPRIQHILCRDERNAGYAADAYARLTGKVGVCDATVGPGTTKFVDALGEAFNNSIPIIAIVADHPRDWMPLREVGVASQGIDQGAFLKPITKAVYEVTSQASIASTIRSAFRTATSNRPGPVAIIIPHDIFDMSWNYDTSDIAADDRYVKVPPHRPRPIDKEIFAASQLIMESKRPTIVCGGGVMLSEASDEVTRLAHRIGACVVYSLTGKGCIRENDPLSAGLLSPLGNEAAERLTRESDLLIFVGTKLSQNTSLNWTIPEENQFTIHIDIDSSQLGRTFRPSVALQGDAKTTLGTLIETVPAVEGERLEWFEQIQDTKAEIPEVTSYGEIDSIKPQAVMRELAKLLQSNDIVISDASFSAGWTANFLPAIVTERRFLYARGLGGMGYAIPAAIGAAAVFKNSKVITVNGDGSACLAIGELSTFVQHRMNNVIHIIINNRHLAWIRYWQKFYFGERYLSTDLPEIDFSKIAQGFGCHGELVTDPCDLTGALNRCFNSNKPAVLDVRCDLWETPIRSFTRRLEKGNSGEDRPGTKYSLRPWVQSPTNTKKEIKP